MVFGRVIRGYADTIQKIATVPTDDRDRPSVPVVISHCGELVLRKPAQQALTSKGGRVCLFSDRLGLNFQIDPSGISASASESDSDGEERRKRKKSRRTRRDSRSNSPEIKKRRDKDRSAKRSKHDKQIEPGDATTVPKKETEEEYDARLEREENERIAEEKHRELIRTAERLARKAPKTVEGGVIYKGRGRMKYIDPESQFYKRDD